MDVRILEDRKQIGAEGARRAAEVLKTAIGTQGRARMIAATGTSQFELLAVLSADRSVDWSRVELFHLDEYIGLSASHPASFRRFLIERLIAPTGIRRHHLLDGEADPGRVIAEVTRALREAPIDLACVGVGENGHLAFNEPPADFTTSDAFVVVALDDVSRAQQVGEGWFATLDEVPTHAITMTVPQILKAAAIVCLVPDARKAPAVRACFYGPVTPMAPASALQRHPRATVYLDRAAAALIERAL